MDDGGIKKGELHDVDIEVWGVCFVGAAADRGGVASLGSDIKVGGENGIDGI